MIVRHDNKPVSMKKYLPEDKRQMFLTKKRLFTAINHSVWRNPPETAMMIGIAGRSFLVNSSNTHKKHIRQ
jgi:hypothetical protein